MVPTFTQWLWIIPAVAGVALAAIGWLWIVDAAFKDNQVFGLRCLFWPGMLLYVRETWPKCSGPMKLMGWGLASCLASAVLFGIEHSN
jgi:hypothetical protein